MEIYFYKSNAHGGSSEQEALIKKSLIDYVQKKYKGDRENRLCGKEENEKDVLLLEKLCDALNNAEIKRGEYGKPYIAVKDTDFAGFDGSARGAKLLKCVEFSVSHSGGLFACAVAERKVGVDIQEIRKADTFGIAERFFADEERAYAKEHGEGGFFDIWVRKEAVIKCTGRGLAQGLSSFSTVGAQSLDEDKKTVFALLNEIELDGELHGKYSLLNVDISPEMKCAVCIFEG